MKEMPWINEIESPLQELVSQVKQVRTKKGGNGIILKCQSYDIFLWSDSTDARNILTALEVYVQSGKGREIEIHPFKKGKSGFYYAKGKETTWYEVNGTYSTSISQDDINPLL